MTDVSPLLAKVLTVSDGVIAGTRVDTSGSALVELLERHGTGAVHAGSVRVSSVAVGLSA